MTDFDLQKAKKLYQNVMSFPSVCVTKKECAIAALKKIGIENPINQQIFDLIKPDHWKQITAADCLTVILSSLTDHLDNFEGNVIDKNKFIKKAKEHLEQLEILKSILDGLL